jgi:ssDNA-binding Zn-finger/Zn-ribbon topoisomerase 1
MARKKKVTDIQLCPKCKKPTLIQASNVSGWLDSSSYRCTDAKCGYVGRFFITVNPDELKKQGDGVPEGAAPKDGAGDG